MGLAVALGLYPVVRRLTNRLEGLQRGVQRWGDGDLSVRVSTSRSRDEVGVLSRAFNRMTERLGEQNKDLISSNDLLDRRRALIEAVLSGVTAGVISVTPERRIRVINRSASSLLNVHPDEATGLELAKLAPEFDVLLDNPRGEAVVELPSAGETRTLVVKIVASEFGQILTFDDITQQLVDQRQAAWSDVARRIAHEIKNPLASLRSALDGAERIQDPALRKQLMDVAKADVQRMDRLISDISDASRVDSQLAKAKFEPIDLGDMIEQLLQAREHRGSDKDVNIAFARPRRTIATVMGEDVRLERMLTNLIDNAVSFSPPGAVVEISATLADEEVIIRISDEGPGVPPQEREAIFRRFHSERPPTENFGKHSGLGLAIARTIVEGHHGRINVRDRVDGKGGACFEIALPCAAVATR